MIDCKSAGARPWDEKRERERERERTSMEGKQICLQWIIESPDITNKQMDIKV